VRCLLSAVRELCNCHMDTVQLSFRKHKGFHHV
jgi:hypothetical protein